MRTFLILFGLVLAIFAGGIFWMFAGAGSVLHHAVERIGSASVGTKVRVKDVNIDVITGQITFTGLEVANPPGYGAGPAIVADKVDVVMAHDVGKGGLPVLGSVAFEAPRINYETGTGGSNLAVLLANARKHAKDDAAAAPAEAGNGQNQKTPPPPRLIIRNLFIQDGHVTLDRKDGKPLDDIHLKNLGGTDGETAPALLPTVLAALLAGIEHAAIPAPNG